MFAGPVVIGFPIGFEEVHPSYDAFGTRSTSCSFVTKLKAIETKEIILVLGRRVINVYKIIIHMI